jgi:hypothetical protein
LRAKVQVANESADHGVVAYWGEPSELTPGADRYPDPRAQEFGFREILPRARAELVGEGELAAYEALRISLGAPKGGVDFAYGDAFPHEANFDSLAGVDFHKGCYVGQEVVSRMQHRGGARKRVVRVELEGPAPEPGTQVLDGDLPAGTLGAASGRFALALMRLDRVEDARAAGRSLKAGEAIVSVP